MKTFPAARLVLAAFLLVSAAAHAAGTIVLSTQRRDPATGGLHASEERVDPARVGIVVVDLWNWHWCKTSTERVAALVPRLDASLDAARRLGMTVFLCPTDVADNHAGTPMFERALAVDPDPEPDAPEIPCPPAPDGGGCTCGAERCRVNYGWDGMHPGLSVGPDDLMPNDAGRLRALCRQRGITHLVYAGVHTQVCLLGKSIGLRAMARSGFRCLLARDLTDAHGRYEPGVETPDEFTAKVVAHFEKHLAATVDLASDLRRAGAWRKEGPVDVVRHAPWGTVRRPHLFEGRVRVTLAAPQFPGASIRYTLDGSDPVPDSPVAAGPLPFEGAFRLRAAAFDGTNRLTLVSESVGARLGAVPPAPDVPLASLKPWRAAGPGHSPTFADHRYSPGMHPPVPDRNYDGQPIRMRGRTYGRGLGVHAPGEVVYDADPAWGRFVAVAGIDEHLLDVANGSNRASHPSVVFRVFLDGRLAAESPVMRMSEEPWRFDVPIPAGTRRVSLAATDAGDGWAEDVADWADAGFVRRAP